MKKKRFSVEQITSVLQQVKSGMQVGDVCRQVGVSEQTFDRWKQQYGAMLPSEARELKQLGDEKTIGNISGVSVNITPVLRPSSAGSADKRLNLGNRD